MSLLRALSPNRILRAAAKSALSRMRGPDLLVRAKAELLRELKSDKEFAAAARRQAIAEIKSRPEVVARARKQVLLEEVLHDIAEHERAVLRDAIGFVDLYDYTEADIESNRRIMEAFAGLDSFVPRTINWFVPTFEHIFRGGIRTILSFADYFQRQKGVTNRIIVYGRPGADPRTFHHEILKGFPGFPAENVIVYGGKNPDELPEAEAAVATLWTGAFHVLKLRNVKAKFYLVQDFEPLFYPAGTIYGMIAATYRFGFWGIANTPGVGAAYHAVSGAPTHSFIPAVDTTVYSPLPAGDPKHQPGEPKWVVFYGRPNNPRNCFELGIRALSKLKQRLGDGVRVISVGHAWDPVEFGVEGVIENWGLLGRLEEVADLYRHCDAGLCFMQTPHPSYQPLEYMACGCPTVSNKNAANEWLLKDGWNCLLTEPVASAAAEALERVLCDEELSRRIMRNGLETIGGNNWPQQMEAVFDFMCKRNSAAREGELWSGR